jgi:hypothetical protein
MSAELDECVGDLPSSKADFRQRRIYPMLSLESSELKEYTGSSFLVPYHP